MSLLTALAVMMSVLRSPFTSARARATGARPGATLKLRAREKRVSPRPVCGKRQAAAASQKLMGIENGRGGGSMRGQRVCRLSYAGVIQASPMHDGIHVLEPVSVEIHLPSSTVTVSKSGPSAVTRSTCTS